MGEFLVLTYRRDPDILRRPPPAGSAGFHRHLGYKVRGKVPVIATKSDSLESTLASTGESTGSSSRDGEFDRRVGLGKKSKFPITQSFHESYYWGQG